MEFYRVEFLMDNFKESNNDQNKRNQEQQEQQKNDFSMSGMKNQQNAMMKKYMGGNNNLGKLPKM